MSYISLNGKYDDIRRWNHKGWSMLPRNIDIVKGDIPWNGNDTSILPYAMKITPISNIEYLLDLNLTTLHLWNV